LNFLFMAHSGFRYLVLLAGVASLVYAIAGAIRGGAVDKPMRILSSAFAGCFHVQILLGFALILTGRFSPMVIGHFVMMLFAAACAQIVPSVMRRRPPERRTWMPYVIGTAAAIAVACAGILALGRPIVG
jgi:hypothetical protein